jgi:hypothetical protein
VEPTAEELMQIVMNDHPLDFIIIPDRVYMILNMIRSIGRCNPNDADDAEEVLLAMQHHSHRDWMIQ